VNSTPPAAWAAGQAHRDVPQIRAWARIAPHDERVVARHDELGGVRQLRSRR